MKEFKIWQVVGPETDALYFLEYAFASLDYILRRHPEFRGKDLPTLPQDAWELTYVYQTEKEPSLDWLYTLFNRGAAAFADDRSTPEDFEGRSMSVGDIIETPDKRLWFCDSIGWKEVAWA